MKKIVLAALGVAIIGSAAADSALAAQRLHQRNDVQAPVRSDSGFRNSYNAYGPAYETRGNLSGLAEGGAVSAPAGR